MSCFSNLLLFLAILGLHCHAWTFFGCGEQGFSLVAVHGLLTAVASPLTERSHRFQSVGFACCSAWAQ